jgi:hypothetical protein
MCYVLGGSHAEVSHYEIHHRQAVIARLDYDLRTPA